MSIKIETPPTLVGGSDSKIQQLVSYLYKLSENLNIALNTLDSSNFAMSAEELAQTSAGETGIVKQENAETYNDLRSLIDQTANYVRVTEQKLEKSLASNYQAISDDFGTFQENIGSTITATARDVVASYNYDSQITSLQEASAGFSEYKTSTEGYIRQGFIEYDSTNVPILGIAIGQNLTSTEVILPSGEKVQQFDASQSCAFYTATKVSFRINGQEVAYFSNSKLYIGDVEITGTTTIANNWLMISGNNGLSFKYIGGSS